MEVYRHEAMQFITSCISKIIFIFNAIFKNNLLTFAVRNSDGHFHTVSGTVDDMMEERGSVLTNKVFGAPAIV